jgi:MFS family permease
MLFPLSFFIGMGSSVIPVLFGSVRDIVRPATRGVASGLVNMGGFAGGAIAQPIFGYLLDRGWQGEMLEGAPVFPLYAFQQGIFLCCAMAALGVVASLMMKETHCKPIYEG